MLTINLGKLETIIPIDVAYEKFIKATDSNGKIDWYNIPIFEPDIAEAIKRNIGKITVNFDLPKTRYSLTDLNDEQYLNMRVEYVNLTRPVYAIGNMGEFHIITVGI